MREWENGPEKHTHAHTHKGSEKGTICKPSKIKLCSRHHIMTYDDSVLRYHSKISVQPFSK